jgi:hypothetical protein
MDSLKALSDLIKTRNSIDVDISKIIQRPAFTGHLGEYIASKIFDIDLNSSATQKGHDGFFQSGTLKGKSVNVKFYSKRETLLDLSLDSPPDYYLVLSGPKILQMTSKNTTRPLIIAHVFLIHSDTFLQQSKQRGIKITKQTSTVESQWIESEIYPTRNNTILSVSDEQRHLLSLFS